MTLNSKIHRNKARAWDVALSDSTSKKCSNSAFPTSKHQKTSDLEVSDDLENLSKPTLWRISKCEEVFSSTQRGTYANLKIVSQILTVPNFNFYSTVVLPMNFQQLFFPNRILKELVLYKRSAERESGCPSDCNYSVY